ncbi:MAG: (Fe-S)-binding protein [Desulfosarcinaceae bacterium]
MALEEFLAEADRCSQCSYCKWIPFDQVKSWRFAKNCPSITYHNFNSYSARGRYALTRSLLKGQSAVTDTVRRIVFSCMACGACDVSCKICRYNLEPLDMVRELKFKLIEEGQGLEAHQQLIDFLGKAHNTMMKPMKERGRWADDLDVKRVTDQPCEVLFFAGCRYSYDPQLQATAVAGISLLKQAGLDVGILGDAEMCCGSRVYAMGYQNELTRLAKANYNAWQKTGIKTVVTPCADCAYAFKRLYTQLGFSIEVLHTTEMIHRLIGEEKLKLTRPVPLTVTYHDPCHLGRLGEPYIPWQGTEKKIKEQIIAYEPRRPRNNGAFGVYDPPREILRAIPGLRFVEMQRIREYSWCCGAGGGVREAYPDYADWTAGERVAEAASTGAQALVSACPWCERSFMDAVNNGADKIDVYDLIDLVRQAI